MASSHNLTYPRQVSVCSFGAAFVMLCFTPLASAPLFKKYRCQVTRVASCTLPSVSFEGLTRSSSALPRFLPPSPALPRFLLPSLSHFLRPASLPPSFPSSPPSIYLLYPGGSGRVAKQAAGMPFSCDLSVICPLISYAVCQCQPQPRKAYTSMKNHRRNFFHGI